MKICVLGLSHPTNDLRVYYKEIQALKEWEHTEKIYWFAQTHEEPKVKPEGKVISFQFKFERGLKLFINFFRSVPYLWKLDYDVIHSHDILSNFTAIIFSKIKNVPVILDVHERMFDKHYQNIHQLPTRCFLKFVLLMEKYLLPKHSIVLCASDYNVCKHYKQMGFTTESVMNFPIDKQIPKTNKNNDVIKLIYVGKIDEERGLGNLIRELIRIDWKATNPIKLIAVGKSVDFNNELLDNENIEYIESFDQDIISMKLQESHIGMIPFKYQGQMTKVLPTKYLEYAHHHLPIISSNLPQLNSYMPIEDVGVAIKEIDELKQAIIKVINNYDSYSEKAYLYGSKLNWETEKKKLIKIYEKLLE